jgi:hypothetical protein
MKLAVVILIVLSALTFRLGIAYAEVKNNKAPVQYEAPSDGHYVHGHHCVDGRVF